MSWFRNIFGRSQAERLAVLQEIQDKFSVFRALLDRHNHVLKLISRLEEKQQNLELGGIPALWDEFVQIRQDTSELIERMIALGGNGYAPLRAQLAVISKQVESFLPAGRPVPEDDFTIPFARLGKERTRSVGGKNANLGEMKSRLGLPVPDGFAISAWAYKHFLDANHLQDKLRSLLAGVRIRKYQDLEVVSEEIQETVNGKPVPDDLAAAIYQGFDQLAGRSRGAGFALRSSAVGEDTDFTFAGQYLSFLNIRRESLLDRYKAILASKFTPSAIYYLLSHSLSEMDLAMGVVCMEMVEAAASGVVYTRDPVNPAGDYVLVNAIFGLGSYLVEGVLTPDVFQVSRTDPKVTFSRVAAKPVMLALRPEGGVAEQPVPEADQNRPSLSEAQLLLLAEYALKLEAHYGSPQDIEWALDSSGELFLVQTRPLKLPRPRATIRVPADVQPAVLLEGGTPICAGVGVGPVFHLFSVADLEAVPPGSVLVTAHPSPKLVAVMHKISALVTMVGGSASHLATLARELNLPTVVGMPAAAGIPPGREVTVDAGRGVIYEGSHPDWIAAPPAPAAAAGDAGADAILKNMIAPIVRLEAISPGDARFTAENCGSLHDLIRFIHQKSMEEIFAALKRTTHKDALGLRLKTKIPLLINIIYLDQGYRASEGQRWVSENAIDSPPLKALWDGVLQEGWPQIAAPADLKGFLAVVGTSLQEGHQPEFSEDSYAFLSREYLLLNLRMGYHFSTIEAMVTPEPEKNYIRMQFKLGGAPLERRIRRIWLLGELMRLMGFENSSQGDFLDSVIAYQGEAAMLERLRLLGRITILTKQLDLTLSSDTRARWYLNDFTRKLGLQTQGA